MTTKAVMPLYEMLKKAFYIHHLFIIHAPRQGYTHTPIHTYPCTRTPMHSHYSLSNPLKQSTGANCVATASQTCLEAAGQSQMAQALACPRCQQAPLALSARLPAERGKEMGSQIESHLITFSPRLQLSRRVRGPCHLCGWPS